MTQPAIDQRPTHTTPDNPREELAALLAGWLEALDQAQDDEYRTIADRLVERFIRVIDRWEVTPGGSFGEQPGESYLHQRYLIAEIWREDVVLRRGTDRSVG